MAELGSCNRDRTWLGNGLFTGLFKLDLMVGTWTYKQLNAKKCCTVLINECKPTQRNQREPLGLGRRRMSVEKHNTYASPGKMSKCPSSSQQSAGRAL